MSELSLKSSRDGSLLVFSVCRRMPDETEFEVSVETNAFGGRAIASTYHVGSPSALFRAMANDWRGWSGEKEWADLESRVAFTATTDSTGHVRLRIDLRDDVNYDDQLRVHLEFEAGQLEDMASGVEELLG